MKYLVGAASLLCACTVGNPLFITTDDLGGGGGGGDGGVMAGDMATTKGDMAVAGVCKDGERRCSLMAAAASEACVNGQFVVDRACPAETKCADGYCQPPASSGGGTTGRACDQGGAGGTAGPQENQCFTQMQTLSCEPFVHDAAQNDVRWFCARAVGTGLPGTPCANGGQCRSGFCGSNGTCFRACQSAFDCPQDPQRQFMCTQVKITVEGEDVAASSCVPL